MCRSVFEAEVVVSGFKDVEVMGRAVERASGPLGIAEDAGPFTEAEIGGDDDTGMLVDPTQQVEEKGTARSTERQVSQMDTRKNLRAFAALMIHWWCPIMERHHGPAFAFQPERSP